MRFSALTAGALLGRLGELCANGALLLYAGDPRQPTTGTLLVEAPLASADVISDGLRLEVHPRVSAYARATGRAAWFELVTEIPHRVVGRGIVGEGLGELRVTPADILRGALVEISEVVIRWPETDLA